MAPYLVTGAAGFLGARFVESCANRGIPCVSVDRLSHFKERREHAAVHFGEIVDRDDLEGWLKSNGTRVDAIMHLGACANTMEMDEAFLERVNVQYSQMLWKFASAGKLPMVYASSAATYGAGERGYDDDESKIASLAPLNPYGWSKQRFDLWALAQEKSGVSPRTWAGFKFFNAYGFGERHKGRMASVVLHSYDQIREKGSVRLFRSHKAGIADGEQKRDFVFVDDVVSVLHFALEKPIPRGIFNLGTGKARSFLDLARATFSAMGRSEKIEFIDTPIEIRDKYQYFTEAKMERLRKAGYSTPFTSLEEGVGKYVGLLHGSDS